MFFSQKPNTILYVQRSSLMLLPKSSRAELKLSDDVWKYLEIRDEKRLREQVAEFVQKSGLRGKRVLIILNKDVVFQKAATIADGATIEALTADFEHIIPFDPVNQRAVAYRQKEKLFLFGANRLLYQLLTDCLEQAGAKVVGVTPAVMYGVTEPAKLTPAKFDQICDASSLTKAVNFLDHP
jgi:hypothetical protein